MVPRILIAGFDHLGEFHNEDFLHPLNTSILFLDAHALLMHVFNKAKSSLCHRIERFVQMSNFIFGINPEACHIIHGLAHIGQVQICTHIQSVVCTHRGTRNFHGRIRHLVHRSHKAMLHHLDNHHHDNQREAKEQRQKLDKEHSLVAHDGFHRDVCRHIGNSLARSIFKRPVNREEPAKLVIRNNRLNLFAR